ncbi:MAG: bifunctional glutamate N-acetyltransferase/amino-acid acetyltransferase ArgJ [Clostridia bacterium]|nr:bifunctional glutamate N-acetyltransferase/amino-acid acetyltransferase ArgJ [Clostridia bacterium]
MKQIEGGILAAKGYTASGICCGIKKNRTKNDLTLIYSEKPASAAALYTQNLVKGAPLLVTKKHISDGIARAIIVNSGNANTCNADGIEVAERTCEILAHELSVAPEDVVVASTGVIGQPLDVTPIQSGMGSLVAKLSREGLDDAIEGIMTTDTVKKQAAVELEIAGSTVRIGGIAKGSGMIHPDMATMLVFITTDCNITPEMLSFALTEDVQRTFNMVSVDGDTSTNDMVVTLANGLAGNRLINSKGEDFELFAKALNSVTVSLCRQIASDGEGATKLLECVVTGGKTLAAAKTAAKSVICSSLFKAAMFGADANWGRVLCAIGYSGADVDVGRIDVSFRSAAGSVSVCRDGAGVDFSEELAKKVLSEKEIYVLVDLNDGPFGATAWGCDLTYDYVKINGDYRT